MNKMKRFLVALMVATVFGTSFVSCIDNEVSPEIKKIYQGNADLIASFAEINRADARLKLAEAELKKAEATLKAAEATLRIADAKFVEAQAAYKTAQIELEKAKFDSESARLNAESVAKIAKDEAETARLNAESAANILIKAKESAAKIKLAADTFANSIKQAALVHLAQLRAQGFDEAEKYFTKYTLYIGLADGKRSEITSAQNSLNTNVGAFTSRENDSIALVNALATAKADKVTLEAKKQELESSIAAIAEGTEGQKKSELEAKIKEYTVKIALKKADSLLQSQKIANKSDEGISLQNDLDALKTSNALYTSFVEAREALDSLETEKVNKGKEIIASSELIVTTEAKLASYDADLLRLKGLVTTANGVKTLATTAKNTANTAKGIASRNSIAADDEYTRINGLAEALEDTLNIAAKSLADYIALEDNSSLVATYKRDSIALDKADSIYVAAEKIFREDRTGTPRAPGPDGVLGNHNDDNEPNNTTKTYRQITDVFPAKNSIYGDTIFRRVVFTNVEYFKDGTTGNTPRDFPLNLTTENLTDDYWTITAKAFTALDDSDIGKLYNVEADDTSSLLSNREIFAEAITALDAATGVVAASKLALTTFNNEHNPELARRQALYDELLSLFEEKYRGEGNLLSNAKEAKKAMADILTTATNALTTATNALTAATNAVGTATGNVTAFEIVTEADLAEQLVRLPVKIKELKTDIKKIEAKIATQIIEIAAIETKIDENLSDVTLPGKIKELVDKIEEITVQLKPLEETLRATERELATLIIMEGQLGAVVTLIGMGTEAMQTELSAVLASIITATINVTNRENAVKRGLHDATVRRELIKYYESRVLALQTERAEYIGLAAYFKGLAKAALETAISTGTTA